MDVGDLLALILTVAFSRLLEKLDYFDSWDSN
jgi:hypothetical protein